MCAADALLQLRRQLHAAADVRYAGKHTWQRRRTLLQLLLLLQDGSTVFPSHRCPVSCTEARKRMQLNTAHAEEPASWSSSMLLSGGLGLPDAAPRSQCRQFAVSPASFAAVFVERSRALPEV
jgi:hypothetical protein